MGSVKESDVQAYLLNNPSFAQSWFTENVGKDKLGEWLDSEECLDTVQPLQPSLRVSTSAEVFASGAFKTLMAEGRRRKQSMRVQLQEKKSRQNMSKSERELFLDLIRDVANELDVNVLCYKILTNVGVLTKSDRGSLFLKAGTVEKPVLVSKLFDVTATSSLEDCLMTADTEIIVPFGIGIAGTVAKTKQPINIKDCYNDSRFNKQVDKKTGFRTQNLLCMPIQNYEGDIIGVAQIMNKTDGTKEFTEQDEEVFSTYLGFCGIGLSNAQLFEMSVQESKRNQVLLQMARNIFEEQANLDNLLKNILSDAKDVLRCERCCVYLVDTTLDTEPEIHQKQTGIVTEMKKEYNVRKFSSYQGVVFSKRFELENDETTVVGMGMNQLDTDSTENLTAVASKVVTTGQPTVLDIRSDPELKRNETGYKTLLCVPIRDTEKNVTGVLQLIDKEDNKSFGEMDRNTAESFAIFVGLGIHNCMMYENCLTLMAKQTVALEVLSYHAGAPQEETDKLKDSAIPSGEVMKIYDYGLDDDTLSEFETCQATVRMFLDCGVCNKFQVPYEVLCRWTLSVKKNYRPVTYHNWRHAFNVTQTMFCMIQVGNMNQYLDDLEVFGLIVACLCHDLDHRGTNNAFQSKVDSPLATLYGTSTMEHHHFDQCIMILNSPGNNIFQRLPHEDYKKVIKIVEKAILSTDLALYFRKKGHFQEIVNKGTADWTNQDHKDTLRGMMMTACDVSAITKPWEVQERVAHLVASEFFEQGDLERDKLKEEPIAMMDRKKKNELPKMQVGFIDAICMPVYQVLAQIESGLQPLHDGCQDNRRNWQSLADNKDEGTGKKESISNSTRGSIKDDPKGGSPTENKKQSCCNIV